MSFPGASNFLLAARGSCWWKYTLGDGTVTVCSSQGLSIAKGAQQFLKTGQTRVQTTDVFGSHMANTSQLSIDGIVGPATMKVMYAYFASVGTPAALLADIEADFNQHNRTNAAGLDVSRPGPGLRRGTMAALVWCAAHHDGDLSRVEIPVGAIPINWGVAPANDGPAAGTKTCWRMDQPAPPESQPVGAGGIVPSGAGGTTTLDHPGAGGVEQQAAGLSTGAKVGIGIGIGAAALGITAGAVALARGGKRKKRKRRRLLTRSAMQRRS